MKPAASIQIARQICLNAVYGGERNATSTNLLSFNFYL